MKVLTFSALSSSVLLLSLAGCGGGEQVDALAVDKGTATLDTLVGTELVYLDEKLERGQVGSTKTPDPSARMKIYAEGDKIRALYNVKSMGDMYDYDCEKREKDLKCIQRLDQDFVYNVYASMVTQGKDCDAATIKALSPKTSDEVIAAGIKQAQEDMAKLQKNEKQFSRFKREHNYLGNKLQFLFYVSVNANGKMKVEDMYKTFYQGRWQEDFNPVSRNEFVKAPEGLFWGDCEDYALYSRNEAGFPGNLKKEPSNCFWGARCNFGAGDTVHYGYYTQNGEGLESKEGCTYTMDVAYDGKVLAEGQAAQTAQYRGKTLVSWTYSHGVDATGPHPFAMVMHTSCAGEEAKSFTSCARVDVK
jgi:hypothetical protein